MLSPAITEALTAGAVTKRFGGLVAVDNIEAPRTPTPRWTPSQPRQMMHATTDCGRPDGRRGPAAELGPREV
jgi:hypothetical protein